MSDEVSERSKRLAKAAKMILAAKRKLREAELAMPLGTDPQFKANMVNARNTVDAVGYQIAQMLSAAMAEEEKS